MKNLLRVSLSLMVGGFVAQQAQAVPVPYDGTTMTLATEGVVGMIDAGTQAADAENVTEWATYLLNLAVATTVTVDANAPSDGVTEVYATNTEVDYSGTLTAATDADRVNDYGNLTSSLLNSYEYVLAKYNGQNAGYVLFDVDAFFKNIDDTILPEFSYNLWGSNPDQYQLSNVTGFNKVPDGGATIALLGVVCLGLQGMRRKLLA